MSTTDDIMAMRKACDMQGLSQEFEDLVAERDQLASYGEALNSRWIEDTKRTGELVAERDLAIHEQDTAQESLRRHQMWLQEAQAERDALRQDVQRLSEALRQEIDPPTFMGEPVSLLRKPVKSIADIKECYCPQDKCQAPVIMGRQTPCIRKMKEQK